MKDSVKGKISSEKIKKDKKNSYEEENFVKHIGEIVFQQIKDVKFILILDFIVFLLLFHFIPLIIFEVRPYVWMTLFVVFTVLPTVFMYLKETFKDYQILIGIPLYYVCILSILRFCTMNELYGISSLGSLDRTPAWVDAIFVVFIIVFFQYLGVLLGKLIRTLKKD